MVKIDNNLKILISGILDATTTERKIDEQLKSISNRLETLKLDIEIDPKVFSIFTKLSDNVEKITRSLSGQRSAIQDVTNETKKETEAINKQISAVKQLNLLKEKIVKTGSGQKKQEIITTGDKFNQKTQYYLPQEDGSIRTTKIVEVFDKQKLDEARNNLDNFISDAVPKVSKLADTIGTGNEQVQKIVDGLGNLNEHSSRTDFSGISKQIKELETSTNNMLNEAYSANEKYNKDLELLDRAHFMALRDNKKRIEDMDKLHHKAILQNNKREEDFLHRKLTLETRIADIRRRFGSEKGVSVALDGLNKQLSNVTSAGTFSDGKRVGDYAKGLRDVDLELKKITASANTARSNAISFSEAFKTAAIKFPIWMAASTAFFQTLHFFTKGISYVNDLNSALTEISIVTGKNQQEVNQLGIEYNQLAKEMKVTTRSVAEATVEFYRQGLSQSEVMERVRVATQYAKISNMEFNQSAEILTAATNSMNISIERASDVFAYLGDATATGKILCPLVA